MCTNRSFRLSRLHSRAHILHSSTLLYLTIGSIFGWQVRPVASAVLTMQNHRQEWEGDNLSYTPTSGRKGPNEDIDTLPLSQQLKHTNHQNLPLHFPTRSSLGQFIERSTSAPPLSVMATSDDDATQLLDNAAQLLENVRCLSEHFVFMERQYSHIEAFVVFSLLIGNSSWPLF